MGMFGALSDNQFGLPVITRPAILDAQTRSPKAFEQGGVGRTILGVLGDALAASNGMSPVFMGGKIQAQQLALANAAADRKRQQDLQDAITLAQAKAQADAQYRAPPAIAQDYSFLNTIHPGLGDTYATQFANGPPVAVDIAAPDGSVTRQFLPRNAMGTGSPTGQGAVPTVTDQRSYDTVPPGAQYRSPDGQIRVKGGASQLGSRPFP